MTELQETRSKRQDWHDSPIAWFVMLDEAVEAGRFADAEAAKRELERLGVRVSFRKLRPTARGGSHAG